MKDKSKSKTTAGAGGIGFTGALQIAFIILKLLNKITWSWFWVLAPTWISAILVILIIVALIMFTIFVNK